MVFTVDAATTGRRSGKSCVKATKKNRRKKHCTRYTRAGRFAIQSKAGANTHHFTGRIGSKKLQPGSYRITLVATDAAGNHSGRPVNVVQGRRALSAHCLSGVLLVRLAAHLGVDSELLRVALVQVGPRLQ